MCVNQRGVCQCGVRQCGVCQYGECQRSVCQCVARKRSQDQGKVKAIRCGATYIKECGECQYGVY